MRWFCTLLIPSLVACTSDGFQGEGKGPKSSGLAGLVGILITPSDVLLPIGQTVQLTATGLTEDRESIDLTDTVTWRAGDEDVAWVSDGLDEEGLLSAEAVGNTTIMAAVNGIESPEITVAVTDAQLERLTVEPDSLALQTGDKVQLTASARFSDGSTGDVSAQVRWIVDDGSVAQVSTEGKVSAKGAGQTTLLARWDDTDSPDVPVVVTGGSSGGDEAPDLSITTASGSISGGVLDLSVTVSNAGDASATGFWVDVFIDPSGTPDTYDTGQAYVWLDYLGAGDSEHLEFQLDVDDSSVEVWVLADTNDDIDESKENNNSFSATVSGGSGGSGPNLEITYFDYYANSETIWYFIDVTNTGDEDAGFFYVDVYIDEYSEPALYSTGDAYTSISGLSAGATDFADFEVETWCYWCESWAFVDSYDSVEESDEDDNMSGPMTVESE